MKMWLLKKQMWLLKKLLAHWTNEYNVARLKADESLKQVNKIAWVIDRIERFEDV
jgi:hypothetical protein